MEGVSEDLVTRAQNGERAALEEIVRRIQDRVYGLALKMLFNTADAEDAAQEILIKVVTRLGGFEGRSRFETWVYRVAANHLLTVRKSRSERLEMTLERYTAEIDRAVAYAWTDTEAEAYQGLVVEEIRLSCLNGLLLCLDRDQRLAFILGDMLELDSGQGAEVLDITPAAFRKRLSRARTRLKNFLGHKCGLMNPDNPCRCAQAAGYDLKSRWINPDRLRFAAHPARTPADKKTLARLPELEEMARMLALLRCQPDYVTPRDFVRELRDVVNAGRPGQAARG
ncbi:MAG: RNA polymerase sigma factor [Proteobacteria bacterium]|nr:RNA polymerase sigma factor [Pseudomonadota bacterium]MBU1740755.1 RNA polymerase sigma factor [Pseudomonadota bacterium]